MGGDAVCMLGFPGDDISRVHLHLRRETCMHKSSQARSRGYAWHTIAVYDCGLGDTIPLPYIMCTLSNGLGLLAKPPPISKESRLDRQSELSQQPNPFQHA